MSEPITSLRAIRGDITVQDVDAVVNAANTALAGGGGVDGAIHRVGGPIIARQCREWIDQHGSLATGGAMVTDGGDLPARHVIHTAGPIYGREREVEARRLLSNCYRNSLDLAMAIDCESVAFPNISTGVYGYPKREAGAVALAAVSAWIEDNPGLETVLFVCHDPENYAVYSDLLDS